MIPHDNTGATILLPSGTIVMHSRVRLDRNGIVIRGLSRGGSKLLASGGNTIFFTATGNGFANYVFEDFGLEANTISGSNATVGFQFVNIVNAQWNRIASNNVWRLFDIDRGNSFIIRDIWTWGESNARFWDSTAGSNFIRWVDIDGWQAYSMLSWDSEPVFSFNYAASCVVKGVFGSFPDFTARGGIRIDGHAEDITLSNISFIWGTYAISAYNTSFSKFVELDTSGTGIAGIICDGCFQVRIADSTFIAYNGGDLIHLKNTDSLQSGDIVIASNSFGGNGAYFGDGTSIKAFNDWGGSINITGNTFTNVGWAGLSRGIHILNPNVANLVITGNNFGAEGPQNITTISNANPMVITSASAMAPPRKTGGRVYFTGGTGAWAAVNAPTVYVMTVIDATHFSVPVDSTAFGPYGAQNIKFQAANIDIDDAGYLTGNRGIIGNTHDDRRDPASGKITSDLYTNKRLIHDRDFPAAGTDTILQHVKADHSATNFALSADFNQNYAFLWPGDPFVFFNLNGQNVLVLSDTQITVGGSAVGSRVTIPLNNLPTFADNAAATAGGLTAGMLYRTAAGAVMVRF
jgi:hypothetical protein